MDNLKKYLPSKKFASIILVIIVFIALFFAIKETVFFFKDKKTSGNDKNGVVQVTVGEVIQKDSNDNGIADWEEYLWGLDPAKNGPENKETIENKKKALTQSGGITIPDDSKAITENEILSREFFATIVSLQQTGSLNEESLNSVSDSIGQKIEAIPIEDAYTKKDLVIKNDSTSANKAYYDAYGALVTKYENADIGSELTLISQGLGNNDPQALYAAKTVAAAYVSFADEFIKIPVPSSLATIHLDLANNYYKVGQSIQGLVQVISDPIIGMRAIINYKQYSDALVLDVEKLAEILQ